MTVAELMSLLVEKEPGAEIVLYIGDGPVEIKSIKTLKVDGVLCIIPGTILDKLEEKIYEDYKNAPEIKIQDTWFAARKEAIEKVKDEFLGTQPPRAYYSTFVEGDN